MTWFDSFHVHPKTIGLYLVKSYSGELGLGYWSDCWEFVSPDCSWDKEDSEGYLRSFRIQFWAYLPIPKEKK